MPESVSVQLLSSGHFSVPATHPLFWHPVLLPFSLPADMIHCNSGFLLFPEQCSLSHFPDPCSHCISCICISHFFPFPEPKRKYNMSYDGTEKEPAKRIKIKRSLVIFPFCRLLIVFCYIQLVYKLLRSGIIFKDSRCYRNQGSGSSVQSDGPPTGSFYSVIYYSCNIFILLILFKSDFFSDPGLS